MKRSVFLGALLALAAGSYACGGDKNSGSEGLSGGGTSGQVAGASGGGAGTAAAVGGGGSGASGVGGVAGTASSSGTGGAGAAGSAGSAAGASAGAGSGAAGAGTGGSAGTDAGASGASGTGSSDSTGSLPPVTDLQKPGPFTPTQSAGPSGYVLFYPQELGKDGVKHPIISWGPGATENAASFTSFLKHLASHGFAIISYDGTPQGQELVTAIDWMIAENARSGSMFYQKLDTTKIAAAGHSAGSIATFKIGADARLTTTVHLSGGTFDPHTDIMNLHAPTMFICGDAGGDGLLVGDVARPNCDIDFMNAKVPVFYGNPKGAAHMSATEIGDATLRSTIEGAFVGWLRWQLADDQTQKAMFVGASCTLCGDSAWTVQQRDLK